LHEGALPHGFAADKARIALDAIAVSPGGMLNPMPPSRRAYGLALLLAVAGGSHFAAPRVYDPIVPRTLPGRPRMWTYLSGAAELAVALAVAHPHTRRAGALAAAALFAAVFPANVKMARDWRRHRPAYRAAAYARLPMQAPLIWWALRVARQASTPTRSSTTQR
jgi:uncharacterized membrane protein